MSTFESFDFAAPLAENLKRHGFETPTPIQAQAIPAIIEGRDVVGLAATGTGKTAAFVLPMLHKLSSGPRRHVRALIIGPTRELAEQITGVVHELGRGTHLHTAMIFGGVSYRPQFDAIRRGAEIVIACPGRLLDHIRQGTIRLDQVEILVLDEADQMFDMGFLPDIKEIIRRVSPQRQTLLFSATMPTEIRRLAQEILRNPQEIKLAHAAPAVTVTHAIFPVKQDLKASLLVGLLRGLQAGPVLVFTRTRHRTKKLGDHLNKAGFRATSIEGGLSQGRRKQAMDGFRSGRFQILVATDVAARGIDVSGISHVINFDMPATVDAYTHRIGRTGRAAKSGDAYTLVTREDAGMVRQIERVLRAPIERRYLDGFEYEARPVREHAPREHTPREHTPREHTPREHAPHDRPRPSHHEAPRREFRRDEAPRRDERPRHDAPRGDEMPGENPVPGAERFAFGTRFEQQKPDGSKFGKKPYASKFGKKPFGKKPFGSKFGKKPFGSKFGDRPHGPRRSPGQHASRDAGPTMTGNAPYQKPSKPKQNPFWQPFSRPEE